MVVLHYELVISTLRRKIFLGVSGRFLRNIGSFFTDVERLNVKVNLFFQAADLTFQGRKRSWSSSNAPQKIPNAPAKSKNALRKIQKCPPKSIKVLFNPLKSSRVL